MVWDISAGRGRRTGIETGTQLVLTREDGEVTAYFRWLAHTHAMRWHVAHNTVGRGHLYQGRFKSFPIQEDDHFYTACRYVERNALTAGVVERAELWRWGSLWAWRHGSEPLQGILSEWPLDRPRNWAALVNRPMTDDEAERLQTSIARNRPNGDETWQDRQAKRLGLPKRRGQVHVFGQRFSRMAAWIGRKMDQTPDSAILLATAWSGVETQRKGLVASP